MVASKDKATLWNMQAIFYSLAHDNSSNNSDVHTGLARTTNSATGAAGGICCHKGATRM